MNRDRSANGTRATATPASVVHPVASGWAPLKRRRLPPPAQVAPASPGNVAPHALNLRHPARWESLRRVPAQRLSAARWVRRLSCHLGRGAASRSATMQVLLVRRVVHLPGVPLQAWSPVMFLYSCIPSARRDPVASLLVICWSAKVAADRYPGPAVLHSTVFRWHPFWSNLRLFACVWSTSPGCAPPSGQGISHHPTMSIAIVCWRVVRQIASDTTAHPATPHVLHQPANRMVRLALKLFLLLSWGRCHPSFSLGYVYLQKPHRDDLGSFSSTGCILGTCTEDEPEHVACTCAGEGCMPPWSW